MASEKAIKLYRHLLMSAGYTAPIQSVMSLLKFTETKDLVNFLVSANYPAIILDQTKEEIKLNKNDLDEALKKTQKIYDDAEVKRLEFINKSKKLSYITVFVSIVIVVISGIAASTALEWINNVIGGILAAIAAIVTIVQEAFSQLYANKAKENYARAKGAYFTVQSSVLSYQANEGLSPRMKVGLDKLRKEWLETQNSYP